MECGTRSDSVTGVPNRWVGSTFWRGSAVRAAVCSFSGTVGGTLYCKVVGTGTRKARWTCFVVFFFFFSFFFNIGLLGQLLASYHHNNNRTPTCSVHKAGSQLKTHWPVRTSNNSELNARLAIQGCYCGTAARPELAGAGSLGKAMTRLAAVTVSPTVSRPPVAERASVQVGQS